MNYNSNENPSIENVLMMAIAEALRNTHTNLIAKVTRVNQKTINCQPVISRVVNDKKIDLPEFAEIPILNFLGGSSSIQMPIAVGDYCILFINERCFDTWYNGQDFEKPLEARIHDYSDAIAFVGLKNKAGELDIPTVITMLGDTYQEGNYVHQGDREQTGDYVLTGDFTINGNTIKNGDLTITGNITIVGGGSSTVNASGCTINLTGGDVVADGISLKNHTHTGDSGGTTSPPN
jgi:hypothetical protein